MKSIYFRSIQVRFQQTFFIKFIFLQIITYVSSIGICNSSFNFWKMASRSNGPRLSLFWSFTSTGHFFGRQRNDSYLFSASFNSSLYPDSCYSRGLHGKNNRPFGPWRIEKVPDFLLKSLLEPYLYKVNLKSDNKIPGTFDPPTSRSEYDPVLGIISE